jgi:hypothetical protein
MRVDITWRELEAWPPNRKPTSPRRPGAFKANVAQTIGELEEELAKIKATEVVVELDVDRRELRVSGEPGARTRTRTTPGIVLHYVDRDKRAVTMPCDRYASWDMNLRALMLTLRALRAVDRYGATAQGEQYRGWTALPSITTPSMSTEKAARTIVSFAGGKFSESRVLASAAECRTALQHAMAKTHPDKHLGDVRDFQLVGECKRIMQAHHGVDL